MNNTYVDNVIESVPKAALERIREARRLKDKSQALVISEDAIELARNAISDYTRAVPLMGSRVASMSLAVKNQDKLNLAIQYTQQAMDCFKEGLILPSRTYQVIELVRDLEDIMENRF